MSNHIEELFLNREHKTKQEQVDASVRFVLQNNKAYYDSLKNLPNRVQAAILTMVTDWMEPVGYHFLVLRAAQRQYTRNNFAGCITVDEPPFTVDELYP